MNWLALKMLPWRWIGAAVVIIAVLGWHMKSTHDAVVADRAFQEVVAQQIEINNSKEVRDRETKNLRRMEINSTNAQADSGALVVANRSLDVNRERLRNSIEAIINRPADAAAECGNDAAFAGAVELFGRAESRASELAKEAGRITGIARESQAYGQACYELTKP
jgi:hypothetical protein